MAQVHLAVKARAARAYGTGRGAHACRWGSAPSRSTDCRVFFSSPDWATLGSLPPPLQHPGNKQKQPRSASSPQMPSLLRDKQPRPLRGGARCPAGQRIIRRGCPVRFAFRGCHKHLIRQAPPHTRTHTQTHTEPPPRADLQKQASGGEGGGRLRGACWGAACACGGAWACLG